MLPCQLIKPTAYCPKGDISNLPQILKLQNVSHQKHHQNTKSGTTILNPTILFRIKSHNHSFLASLHKIPRRMKFGQLRGQRLQLVLLALPGLPRLDQGLATVGSTKKTGKSDVPNV